MDKILNHSSFPGLIEILKENNQKIVFTNGCFDLLHPGHIDYLNKAKKLGDVLVIGINNDESVRELKGNQRPINLLEDRMLMLAALESVDFIIPFKENTPIKLINSILPDVLVKGGDYIVEDIVGYKEVLDNGGAVKIVQFKVGYSSTNLINKIKAIK